MSSSARSPGPVAVLDPTGATLAVQEIRSEAVCFGRRRLAFIAELPALGYRLFRLHSAPSGVAEPTAVEEPWALHNGRIAARVDPDTGWLASLVHLGSGAELIPDSPQPHTVVLADRTDTWSHNVRSYWEVIGAFRPVRVERVESGPVRTTIRVISEYGASRLIEEIRLDADADHLEVAVTVDWREQLTALKLRFPTTLTHTVATHEIPYGYLERPADGDEVPSQNWVDVSGSTADGNSAGLAVLNDGKYSFDVDGGNIGLMAVRSPAFAWHDPARLAPEEVYSYQDQGLQQFRYRVLPHAGSWRVAGVPAAGAVLNQPLTTQLESQHPGPLPVEQSFGSVVAGTVLLTVVKNAEDGDGAVVLRGYETDGTPGTAVIDVAFLHRSITAEFGAHEIKTLLVPAASDLPPIDTDLLERPLAVI